MGRGVLGVGEEVILQRRFNVLIIYKRYRHNDNSDDGEDSAKPYFSHSIPIDIINGTEAVHQIYHGAH